MHEKRKLIEFMKNFLRKINFEGKYVSIKQ